MALPAPVQQQSKGLNALRADPQQELGTIGVSLATQPQSWPLPVAARLLEGYRAREKQRPDLDVIAASKTVECHCTPDLLQKRVYTPFAVTPSTLPSKLLALVADPHQPTETGFLAPINTLYVVAGHEIHFWNLGSGEVKALELPAGSGAATPIQNVYVVAPDKRVFADTVKHVIVVCTTKEMRLYAIDEHGAIFDTDLAISIDGLGKPTVRGAATGRIFFACAFTGTALWEFRYAAKETWFRSKVQRVCHGEYGGLLGGLFGPTVRKDAEHIIQLEVDDSTSLIYALTSESAIHIYSFAPAGTGASLARSLSAAQVRSSLLASAGPQPELKFVAISPVSVRDSAHVRLVAITDSGTRVYFRAPTADAAVARGIAAAYAHRLPLDDADAKQHVAQQSRVADGFTLYAVLGGGRVLASSIDTARVAHQVDLRTPVSFVELSGLFKVDGDVLFVAPHTDVDLVLTTTTLYRVRRRPFHERFEYADAPFALAQVYGPMQLCCGALETASQSTSRSARENAISAYFCFGGLPMFRRDQMATGFLGGATIRLSFLFDGLALYVARILAPVWGETILQKGNVPPDAALLDRLYHELSGLVDFLDKNRSFSEGMSERSGYSSGDDAAVLSQAEYKGLQAMGRLAKSSQQGIAFLRLVLTQQDLRLLLSYFSDQGMAQLSKMTFGHFFTEAKQSDVARELTNALVNCVLSKGDSIDTIANVIQDRCDSYCSAGDVLEYKALECIHQAKQRKEPDTTNLARSIGLVRKAAATIQLETLRDIVRDYVQLKFYSGAVQVSLAVAAEQDPANLALGFLRQKDLADTTDPPSKRQALAAPAHDAVIPKSTTAMMHTVATAATVAAGNASHDGVVSSGATVAAGSPNGFVPHGTSATGGAAAHHANGAAVPTAVGIPESELKYRTKMAVFDIVFKDVLEPHPELADTTSTDPAHAAMLASQDEVWHFALYDWYLSRGRENQIALLDTPFVATWLQLGAAHDLRVANLLWKWHQRHNDLLAAADVLLDLARGPLATSLSQRIEFLGRAMGYCQAQSQQTQPVVNMTTMVHAYLGLALIQADILAQHSDAQLNAKLYTASELFNNWADPLGLYDVCFALYEFTDFRDPVEIKLCWENLLTKTRGDDDTKRTAHYAHVATLITQLGQRYRTVEYIFSLAYLVPMFEQYAVDYCRDAPAVGWLVDAFVNAGIAYAVLYDEYAAVLRNRLVEGEALESAQRDTEYLVRVWSERDLHAAQQRVAPEHRVFLRLGN